MDGRCAVHDLTAQPESGLVPIHLLKPSPENDQLYRPVLPSDPAIVGLANSIAGPSGVLEPLVITADYYVVSGHRRLAACKLAGLKEVPCRQLPLRRQDDIAVFVKLLREHNRQRVKGLDEVVREAVVDIDPEAAHAALTQHRKDRARRETRGGEIAIGDRRERAEISKAKKPMLEACVAAIAAMEEFHPVSVRNIHYKLLNDPPLRHASKSKSIYRNDKASYKALCDLLTRARLTGQVKYNCIADETRPVTINSAFSNPDEFIAWGMENLLEGYWRNRQRSQPAHIEIVAEKNTVKGILKPIAEEYTIPITIGRGYCSIPPRKEMVDRFHRSGKDRLILLVVSDHDPDGEEIAQSLARSIRDDFDIPPSRLSAVKVALTSQQVAKYNLPPSMDAKEKSKNYAKFVKLYGTHAYELEALDGDVLQVLLRNAIEAELDMGMFDKEVEQEKTDAALIEAQRMKLKALLGAA